MFKPLSVLSGGEKSRLALLRMLLKPINLLVLDEPTNHLDLQSKDILLDCLKAFKGTVIFVSHDRGFMEALSTKTLELSPGKPHRLFYGSYAYYLERLERDSEEPAYTGSASSSTLRPGDSGRDLVQENLTQKETESLPRTILIKAGDKNPLPSVLYSAAEHREKEKARQTIIRRLARQEAEIFKDLEELETLKQKLEAELALPEVYSSGEKARSIKQKLDKTAAALEAKTMEWETAAGELEKAKS